MLDVRLLLLGQVVLFGSVHMKKLFLLPLALATLLLPLSVYAQSDLRALDNRIFPYPRRPAAIFVHDTHNARAGLEDCKTCHHVYLNGVKVSDASSEDRRCADCHGTADRGAGLRRVFHLKCKGCHQERRAGPILCGECHRK